jgi:carboxypeptidase Q
MRIVSAIFLFVLVCVSFYGQDNDSIIIRKIFNNELSSRIAVLELKKLCKSAPKRLAGSPASIKAIELMKEIINSYHPDTLYTQEVKVIPWSRGNTENATVYFKQKKIKLHALAIGGSISTKEEGVRGRVIEVHGLEELLKIGSEKLTGKIVFFNEPMDPTIINPSTAYGIAGPQRVWGASEASGFGAKAVIVRSMTQSFDEVVHTGIMHYKDSVTRIPAISISTLEADSLSNMLKTDPATEVFFETSCSTMPLTSSYNIVAEIKGIQKPEEIITVGGHIDSWDVCEGAHDDGAGCIHASEVIRVFRELGIRPDRTVRIVIFIDEEMFQLGAAKYAESVDKKGEKIYAAFESDSGGFLPLGFGCLSSDSSFTQFMKLQKYFQPYRMTEFIKGHGEVDIAPLGKFGVPLLSLNTDKQRYFDYHHSEKDYFESVNPRELQFGCAATVSLIYLVDQLNIFGK